METTSELSVCIGILWTCSWCIALWWHLPLLHTVFCCPTYHKPQFAHTPPTHLFSAHIADFMSIPDRAAAGTRAAEGSERPEDYSSCATIPSNTIAKHHTSAHKRRNCIGACTGIGTGTTWSWQLRSIQSRSSRKRGTRSRPTCLSSGRKIAFRQTSSAARCPRPRGDATAKSTASRTRSRMRCP